MRGCQWLGRASQSVAPAPTRCAVRTLALPMELAAAPTLDARGLTWGQVSDTYRRTQLLLVKGLVPQRHRDAPPAPQRKKKRRAGAAAGDEPTEGQGGWGYDGLSALFAQPHGRGQIESSWNIENGQDEAALTAQRVLQPSTPAQPSRQDSIQRQQTQQPEQERPGGDWYVSFILQDASHGKSAADAALMAQVKERLPVG